MGTVSLREILYKRYDTLCTATASSIKESIGCQAVLKNNCANKFTQSSCNHSFIDRINGSSIM